MVPNDKQKTKNEKKVEKKKSQQPKKSKVVLKKDVSIKKQKAVKVVSTAVTKAQKAKANVTKGIHRKRAIKVRTKPRFLRPKLRQVPKNPKCPSKSVPGCSKVDQFSIVKYPVTSESAMKKIEDDNTLVFVVDEHSNKSMIKVAVKKLYNVSVIKVNTLNTPEGLKKAFVRLSADQDALDAANKIGII